MTTYTTTYSRLLIDLQRLQQRVDSTAINRRQLQVELVRLQHQTVHADADEQPALRRLLATFQQSVMY